MATDGESWQLNLESWRERRRAAARALSMEIQQTCPTSPTLQQRITDSTTRPSISSSTNDIRETLRKFKTMEKLPTSNSDNRFTTEKDHTTLSSGIVKNSPFLISDAERMKLLANDNAHKRSPPIRIRLIYDSDCVKADNLGLVVGAEGADNGPPFIIRGVVKDSMAERGDLQVGDELFSVDNLCCAYTPDRPLLIKNLSKLHQELQRLTNKERPVEVKVFRARDKGKGQISQTLADRVRVSGTSSTLPAATRAGNEAKKDTLSLKVSNHTRNEELQQSQIDTTERTYSTASLDSQKSHSAKRTNKEQVKLKYEDRHLFSSYKDTSQKVITMKMNKEPSTSVIKPVNTSMVEEVIKRDESGDSAGTASQLNYQQQTSQFRKNKSYSPIIEQPNLPPPPPPPPEPGSSDSLIATPSESPPSIAAIQPPPTPPLISAKSSIDQEQSISLIIPSLPPPPPPEKQIPSPINFPNPPHKFRYSEIDIDDQSSKFVSFSTSKFSTLPLQRKINTDEQFNIDMDALRHYDSDVNTADEQPFIKSSKPVERNWRSEATVYDKAPNQQNVSSDIDSEPERPYMHINRPITEREESQPYEEVDTKSLSSLKAKEKVLRFSQRETHYFPRKTISIEKPKVRNPEPVVLLPLQGEKGSKTEQTSTDLSMRQNEERETEYRMHKKLKPASRRIPSDPALRQQNLPSNRYSRVNVIGTWYNCAGCNQQLGSSDLMIIEELGLFFHLSCFNCSRCGIQLSDGQNETSVRIKNGNIYCYICYHRLSKSLTRSKDRSKTRKSLEIPEKDSTMPRTSMSLGSLINASTSYQTSNYLRSIKR